MVISRRIYDHLPIYTKLMDRNSLVEKICDSFQQGYFNVETLLNNLYLYFDPELAPIETLDWLGQLVGLFPVADSAVGTGIVEDWTPEKKRFAILNAQSFFKKKGSLEGIKLGYSIWLFNERKDCLILLRDTNEKIIENQEPRNINDIALEYNNLTLQSITYPDFRYWKNTQNNIQRTQGNTLNKFINKRITQIYNQNPLNRYDIHITTCTKSIEESSKNVDKINQEILPNLITENTFLWYRNVANFYFTDLENPSGYFPLIHKSKSWVLTIYTKDSIYYLNPNSLFFVKMNDDLISLKQKVINDNNFSNENISKLNNYYLDLDICKYHKLPYYNYTANFKDLVIQFPFYSPFPENIVRMSLDLFDKDNYSLYPICFYKETKNIFVSPRHITCFEFFVCYQKNNFFGLNASVKQTFSSFNLSTSIKINGNLNVISQNSHAQSYRLINLDVTSSNSSLRTFIFNANVIRLNVFSNLANAIGEGLQYKAFNLQVQSDKSEFDGFGNILSHIYAISNSRESFTRFEGVFLKIQGTLVGTSQESQLTGSSSISDPNLNANLNAVSSLSTFAGEIGYVISGSLYAIAIDSSFIGEIIHINSTVLVINVDSPQDSILIALKALILSNSLDLNTESNVNMGVTSLQIQGDCIIYSENSQISLDISISQSTLNGAMIVQANSTDYNGDAQLFVFGSLEIMADNSLFGDNV